jgi:hypothetical protein
MNTIESAAAQAMKKSNKVASAIGAAGVRAPEIV